MPVKVHLKNLHISPRKVRLVADIIRGMDVIEAEKQLGFVFKRAANPILKLLNSAVASAKHDFEMKEDNLFISSIMVNEGPTMKRWRPRAYGRAYPIMKRSSHIVLELDEKVKTERKMKRGEKKEQKKEQKKKNIIGKKVSGVKTKIREESKEKKSTPEISKGAKQKFLKEDKPKPTDKKGVLKKIFRRKSV